MAVFFNLAVDCSNNDVLASELESVFQFLQIKTTACGTLTCTAEHIRPNRHWNQPTRHHDDAGNWHTLCVDVGVSMPTKPGDEILTRQTLGEIRDALYEPLKEETLPGQFRAAWFGWEAQDALGESDWLETIAELNRTGQLPKMSGLILAELLVVNDIAKGKLSGFAPGYLWIDQPYSVD